MSRHLWLVVFGVLLLSAASESSAQRTKYGVTVKSDRRTDFSKVRTYAWRSGWSAFDPTIDRQVAMAVDRELHMRGLTKLAAEPCDIVVKYAALRRTDIDPKRRQSPTTKLRREYPVGTLIVMLLEPRSRREVFRGRIDIPLEAEPAKLEAQVDAAIARLFEKYPTRH